MIKKKDFMITVAVLSIIIITLFAICVVPHLLGGCEVTTPENAIILAKAALLRKYGEAEIQKEFDAVIFGDQPEYWYVSEKVSSFGYPPHVLIRRSDGKAIVKWKD